VGQPSLRLVLIIAQVLLLVLYVITFRAFRKWLADARVCLAIRESFYKQPELLSHDPFDPMTLKPEHRDAVQILDTHLRFPCIVTVAAGVILLAYMIVNSFGSHEIRP
jgi:hypothetical protein